MRTVVGILACLGLLAGCEKQKKEAAPAQAQVQAAMAQMAQRPQPANPPAERAVVGLHGKLLEKIDASSYTYLRLSTPSGEAWAAIPATDVALGTEVTVLEARQMGHFESKTLHRTFENIAFGTGLQGIPSRDGDGAGVYQAQPAAQPSAPVVDVQVAKASGPNALTISEIFADKKKLADGAVVFRGKVVKANSGILGRNWLHLRDGSGSEASADHDLAVTTQDTAKVGDVVVVKGTVHLDKDFGAGYAYPVIVEDASLTR